MAIQFFCVACRQPIEVDDEFANQTVTCPYCRKVVTAPAATDQTIQESPPVATPTEAAATPVALSNAAEAPAGTNIWSWISLGCVTVSLISAAIYAGILAKIVSGAGPNITPAESQKLLMQEMQARPGLQLILTIGFCGMPLTSIVCGIVALVKRRPPRWPAITALTIYAILIVLICGSFLVAMANGTAKPAG